MNYSINAEQLTRSSDRTRVGRRARGVASVEAVVALPFFVLIFISLFYLRDELLMKHQLSMTARTCAWMYSESNCQFIPEGCQDVLSTPGSTSSAEASKLHRTLKDAEDKASKLTDVVKNIVTSLLDNVLDAAFGQSFDAIPKGSIARPALFGGGTTSLSSQYHLPCNLAEQTPVAVVTNAWNIFRP